MNDRSVKRYPLSKQVADRLEDMITSGRYEVGEKIPPEAELMTMFSVSRNTLREAIHSLNSAGILEVKQGDGTYVKSDSRFNAHMHKEYAQVSMEDIRETRNSIEMAVVYLAAMRRTDEDMERIEKAYEKRVSLSDSVKENTLADIEFHMEIAKACHNRILIDIYKSIFAYLEDQIKERQIETDLSADEIDWLHRDLCTAIRDKDPRAAERCTRSILNI